MGYAKAAHIDIIPDIQKVITLQAGDSYEMLSELEWHYVQPINGCSYSIMIIGRPFQSSEAKTHLNLTSLPEEKKAKLFSEFKNKLLL